jgi:hypothetical protein
MSFIYNSIPSRHLTALESSFGQGMASVILTIFDHENTIMFPSKEHVQLKITKQIDLKEFMPHVEHDKEIAMKWKGFKIGFAIHGQGALRTDAIVRKVKFSFDHTSVDYALESYYREASWHSYSSYLQSQQRNLAIESETALAPVITIPQLLKQGVMEENPLVQNVSINSEFTLNTIAGGIKEVIMYKQTNIGLKGSILSFSVKKTMGALCCLILGRVKRKI